MRYIMIAVALLLAAGTLVAADPPCPPSWSYCDLNQWPSHCQSGDAQSPIDLPQIYRDLGKSLLFKYDEFTPLIYNTSRSIKVGNPRGELRVDDALYELIEFHFHVPGEHTFSGTPMPMELHLVHRNIDNEELVVAVLFKDGPNADEGLGEIIKALPAKVCDRTVGKDFNAQKLLPDDRNLYYTYAGSRTTPDCDRMTWIVLTVPREATKAQRDALQRAVGGPNARQSRHAGNRQVKLIVPREKK